MAKADPAAWQARLDEISRALGPDRHAVLLLDRAGRHATGALTVPK